MQELNTRLLQAGDFSLLLHDILDAAIAITGAQMGNIQLLEGDHLRIAAQRGFDRPFLEFFAWVPGEQAACGTALQRGERVIVDDVLNSPIFVGTSALDVMVAAGAHAVQSTPLVSRSGASWACSQRTTSARRSNRANGPCASSTSSPDKPPISSNINRAKRLCARKRPTSNS